MNRLLTLLFAASCLTATSQVPDYVPTEGLVAWWAFDGDVQDASNNQIHGTSYAASFVPDRFNNDDGAIHIEGNGLVDFGLDPRFGVVSGAGRTVAFWVKSEMEVIPRLQKYQNSVSGNSNFSLGRLLTPIFLLQMESRLLQMDKRHMAPLTWIGHLGFMWPLSTMAQQGNPLCSLMVFR